MRPPTCAWNKASASLTPVCTVSCVIRCISAQLFLIVGTPLALGSWWTLLLTPVFLLLLYFRIASEEKVLMRDLAGYADYQRKVRYRLIPFLW